MPVKTQMIKTKILKWSKWFTNHLGT